VTTATTVATAFDIAVVITATALLGVATWSVVALVRASGSDRWPQRVELAWTLVPLCMLAALATLLYPRLHG